MTRFTFALLILLTAVLPAAAARRVWIDTDPACGLGSMSDPDDCFALLHLLTAPNVDVVGISTTFGNAGVTATTAVARQLLLEMRRTTPVFEGVSDGWGWWRISSTPASQALARALEQGPLEIVALGPLTNLATALHDRPDLAKNLTRVIAVMGKEPGEVFHPAEGSPAALMQHGPVFSDLNFVKDRRAAAAVFAAGLSITLVPYAAGKTEIVTASDLATLSARGRAAAWVASRAQDWLAFWRSIVGRDGFYPFDLVAAITATNPAKASCQKEHAIIAPDRKLGWFGGGPTSLMFVRDVPGAYPVTVCRALTTRAIDLLITESRR